MRSYLFLVILELLSLHLNAQEKYDYSWLFGYNLNEGANIDFNHNPIKIDSFERDMNIGFTNASICDSLGNLQFYTNGCYIAGADHEMMENGDSINPGPVHEFECEYGYGLPEGAFIIPKPGNSHEYYLIHQGQIFIYEPSFDVKAYPLYYTLVDMQANNGKGKAIEKNQVLVNDTLYYSHLSAVKHANGRDWWVLAPGDNVGEYFRLCIRPDTIEGPYFQSIGEYEFITSRDGQAVFSPDGNKYVRFNARDQAIFIHEFDRQTGQLSNFQSIPFINDNSITGIGGAAISSNSRYLYINTFDQIYQFDLASDDIKASQALVAEYDGFQSPFPTSFWKAQLGPDCRIYLNSPNGVDVLHVIKYPNRPGLECEVIQHGVQLPTYHQASLPNFPHYRTGTPYPICDSTIVLNITTPLFELPDPELMQLSVFPNPAKEQLTIRLTEPQQEPLSWRLYDALGREVLQQAIAPFAAEMQVSIRHLPRGLYFYGVEQLGVTVASGKVVVVE